MDDKPHYETIKHELKQEFEYLQVELVRAIYHNINAVPELSKRLMTTYKAIKEIENG